MVSRLWKDVVGVKGREGKSWGRRGEARRGEVEGNGKERLKSKRREVYSSEIPRRNTR